MRVIVHEEEAIALILDLKTPACVLETPERCDHLLERNPEFRGERDHSHSVAHVMTAGDVQDGFAQFFAPAENAENGSEILKVDIGAAIIRRGREAEGNGTWPRPANPRGMLVIHTIKNGAGSLIEQLGKDRFDRGEVRIKIEVLFLNVQNEGVLGFEITQRPVALIAFRDEIFAAPVPVRVRAEERNLRADIMGRMQSALAQNVRGHGGRCRLAVHPGDDNSALARHDRGERPRTAHRRLAGKTRAGENRIVVLDRRRKYHERSVMAVFDTMLFVETQTEPLQPIRLERADFIGAADVVPELEQQRRNPAHAAAGHADQMDPVPLLREHLR